MNDHYWCTRLGGKNDSCVDPKRLIVKVAASKGCSDRWDAVIDRIYRCCFTPLAVTFGCHLVNHFVCICMQSRVF